MPIDTLIGIVVLSILTQPIEFPYDDLGLGSEEAMGSLDYKQEPNKISNLKISGCNALQLISCMVLFRKFNLQGYLQGTLHFGRTDRCMRETPDYTGYVGFETMKQLAFKVLVHLKQEWALSGAASSHAGLRGESPHGPTMPPGL